MKRRSTLSNFDRGMKSWYDAPPTFKPDRYTLIRHQWDVLRAQLLPCWRCKAPSDDLGFQCAQWQSMAYVWCTKCGAGVKEGTGPGPRWLDNGDARPLAVEAWNQFVKEQANGTD